MLEIEATRQLPAPVTMFSVVGQLMKHRIGYDFIYSRLPKEKVEGGRLKTMPVISLVSYGVASESEVMEILRQIEEE